MKLSSRVLFHMQYFKNIAEFWEIWYQLPDGVPEAVSSVRAGGRWGRGQVYV